jgi:hypothetical protein
MGGEFLKTIDFSERLEANFRMEKESFSHLASFLKQIC